MTLPETLRVVRRRWVTAAGVFLLCVMVASIGTALVDPRYMSTATLYVSSVASGDTTDAYQGNLLSEQKVLSYVTLLGGERIRADTSRLLGFPVAENSITAAAESETVILDVTAEDSSPERAAQIANAAAVSFSRLVIELERPILAGAPATTAVQLVQPATPALEPISPQITRNILVGVLAGLLLSTAAAILRDSSDNTLRVRNDVEAVCQAPIMGQIERWTDGASPLPARDIPTSGTAELFNSLRTAVQFLPPDKDRRIILLSSALPSEGKTTTLCNLAFAMARAGDSVLVVDADLRRPTIAGALGLEGSVGLSTVLSGRVQAERAVQNAGPRVDVLCSGPVPPNPSELIGSQHMVALLEWAGRAYDVVLIDSPPVLPVTDSATLAPLCTSVLLACRMSRTTSPQLRKAYEAFEAVEVPAAGLILTFARKDEDRSRYGNYYLTAGGREDLTSNATSSSSSVLGRGGSVRPSPHRRGLSVNARTERIDNA